MADSDDSDSPAPDPESYHGPIASAGIQDSITGNTLVKIGRSQTAMERSFYRALRDLHQFRSEFPTPPENRV